MSPEIFFDANDDLRQIVDLPNGRKREETIADFTRAGKIIFRAAKVLGVDPNDLLSDLATPNRPHYTFIPMDN